MTLTESHSEDLYLIHGSFETQATPAAVWSVLTDYSALVGILKGLKSSRVLERQGGEILLRQVMQAHFLIFGRTLTLLLRVHEFPPSLIEFSQADGKGSPFRVYQGSWAVSASPHGCKVDYTLRVSRGDLAPPFLECGLFRGNAENLLDGLSREIARRAALAQKAPKP